MGKRTINKNLKTTGARNERERERGREREREREKRKSGDQRAKLHRERKPMKE